MLSLTLCNRTGLPTLPSQHGLRRGACGAGVEAGGATEELGAEPDHICNAGQGRGGALDAARDQAEDLGGGHQL